MKNFFLWLKAHLWTVLIFVSISILIGVYFYKTQSATDTALTYAVVDTIERGVVSSGIHTTGKVVAAQKLDLDVYKQLERIDTVNVANGSHVEAGKVLVSFDKSDALVEAQSTRVTLAEAELSLDNERANATDSNTEIRTLQNKITTYKKAIIDSEQDIKDAYKDFLNEDIEVDAHESDESRLLGVTPPTLSGRYVGMTEGVYVIEVYSSGSVSGYSFRVSGLESGTESVVVGSPVDLGTRGLKISFPNTLRATDTWVVRVPNTSIATYADTKRAYEDTVATLKESIATTKVNLMNTEQELENLLSTDTRDYRNLNVEKAQVTVSSAAERLAQNYDNISERDVVAPFSGTIQDMENVVSGATPTGGSEDTIHLGTLISDEFLTTFTLSASDVAKVKVGQKVLVTVTSFSEQPTLIAAISEISSLPSSDGVAQYEVSAKLDYNSASSSVVLREGVLADIEIVEEEKTDVLRVPVSAITYVDGKPTVQVIDTLTDTQKTEIEKMGILRMTDGTSIPSYPKIIKLGIFGTYFAEVTDGLSEGSYVVTTATTNASDTSVVEKPAFGPGHRDEESSSKDTSSKAP